MNVAAKDSLGVFAECPNCHASIRHGFQVCQNCGALVSAEQQRGLQRLLARNVLAFSALAVAILAVVLYIGYGYLY